MTCVLLLHRSTVHTSDYARAHDLLWWLGLWVGPGPLRGIPQVLVAKTLAEQRDTHHCQHYGLGQRSAQALPCGGERSWGVNPPVGVWTSVLSLAVLRIWISAAGGHDSLLTGVARCPARSRRCHPLSRCHPRVSQNSARLPDAPTRPDSPGRVHREPHPPKKLHSPHCTVRIPGSGTSRNSVSPPLQVHSWHWSLMPNVLWYLVDRRHQRSNEMRELSLLAYLSQMQSSDLGPVRPLQSLVPYQVYDIHQTY